MQWGNEPASNPVALVPDRTNIGKVVFVTTAIGNQRHWIRCGLIASYHKGLKMA